MTGMNADPSAEITALRGWARTDLAARPRTPGLDRAVWAAAVARVGFAPPTGAAAAATRLEALGHGGAQRGLLFALGAHLFGVLAPIARHGSAALRARWEEGLRTGQVIGALAVTELAGGSSFDTLATTAVTDTAGPRLDGRKTLVTNAPDADVLLVLAREFPERGPLGFTMFAVPREAPGLTVRPLPTGGLPGAPMGEMTLDGCRPGADSVLGAPGAGLRVFQSAMAWERSLLLAGFLGAARNDLARAVTALAPTGNLAHQAQRHRVARIHLRLTAARHLLMAAAAGLDAGVEDLATAAMAKLAVSEAVAEAANETARLLAGAGWRGAPFDTAAAMADTLGTQFASGTSDIQLDIIARQVLAGLKRT